jgi:hypothetical protein
VQVPRDETGLCKGFGFVQVGSAVSVLIFCLVLATVFF